MDKRLSLTEAQWRLYYRFNDLCREMRKEKMLFVNNNGNLGLINGEYVDDYVFPEDIDKDFNEVEVRTEKLPTTALNMFYSTGYLDETFGIRFYE